MYDDQGPFINNCILGFLPQIDIEGALSFRQGSISRRPFEEFDTAVIALYWNYIDIERLDGGNIYYTQSTSDGDFARLQQILKTAFSLEGFEITQTFVVTYDRLTSAFFGDRVSYGMPF